MLTHFFIFCGLSPSVIKGQSCAILTCKTNLNKLEVIQNAALRIATGALKSTPIISLQCEAQAPPLKFFVEQQSLKTYYKLMTKSENHPVRKYVLEKIKNIPKWSSVSKKPFTFIVKDLIDEWGTPAPQYLRSKDPPCFPPWEPLEATIHTELQTQIQKASGIHLLRAEAYCTIENKYADHLQVYTDGSKITEDHHMAPSTAAGFCIPSANFDEKWKLDTNISIAGAELSAIHKATDWVLTQHINGTREVVILTDSQVSLHLMKQRKPKSYAYSVTKIHINILKLRKKGWKISFQWIPSHCGIEGNERADALAGEAHSLDNKDNYPVQLEELYLIIGKAYQAKWAAHWSANRRQNDLRDSISPWLHTRHPCRAYDVILTRFRMNHTKLNSHMAAKKLLDSPLCTNCNMNIAEGIHHFLLICPGYSQQRQKLRSSLSNLGVVNPTIKDLLGGSDLDPQAKSKITHLVSRFISETGRVRDL